MKRARNGSIYAKPKIERDEPKVIHYQFQITLEGDSLIDGTLWKKCWYKKGGIDLIGKPFAFMSEIGTKVLILQNVDVDRIISMEYPYDYIWSDVIYNFAQTQDTGKNDNVPTVLYDFDLKIGEGINWPWSFSGSSSNDNYEDEWYDFSITGIRYETYNGIQRKVYEDRDRLAEITEGLGQTAGWKGVITRPIHPDMFLTGYFPNPIGFCSVIRVTGGDGSVLFGNSAGVTETIESDNTVLDFDGKSIRNGSSSEVYVKIYDISGKCVTANSAMPYESFDLSFLQPGIYVAVSETAQKTSSLLKLLINR